ncbi:MAG: hypothetical protein ACK5LT_08495 [Lachnospirales bacterium]
MVYLKSETESKNTIMHIENDGNKLIKLYDLWNNEIILELGSVVPTENLANSLKVKEGDSLNFIAFTMEKIEFEILKIAKLNIGQGIYI